MNERSFSAIGNTIMVDKESGKREAVLQAALELISRNGFHGTPMSQIAKVADVGAGTIYRYFDSKETLINELYRETKARINEVILDGYNENLPIKEALKQIWYNALKVRRMYVTEYRFFNQYYNSPFINDEVAEIRREGVKVYVELIERGIREGILKELPIQVIFSLVMGPVNNFSQMIEMGEMSMDEKVLDQAFEACWDGICK